MLAILVDFPDFNLRLARRLHRQGVRIVYFISPQVWAWRPKRVRLIGRLVERVICIFPFEEKFYRHAGVPVDYVGHPLVGAVAPGISRAEFAAKHGLDAAKPIVGLLPGSRPSEIRHNLPPILGACGVLARERPLGFVLPVAAGLSQETVSRMVAPHSGTTVTLHTTSPAEVGEFAGNYQVSIGEGDTYNALAAADCAIVSSGTATVEAALLGAPMVVVYRVSGATAFIARRLVRTPFFSMVNLIAGRRAVPELIQEDFTPARVAGEVRRLLAEPQAREQMKRELAEVRARLGSPGAIDRAAEIIAGML